MKTNSLITTRTALATAVAGAVFLFAGCGEGEGTQGTEKTQGTATAAERSRGTRDDGSARMIPEVADRSRGTRDPTEGGASRTPRPTDAPWPDAAARILVEHAVNENDYKSLATLLGKLDKIEDPAIRLRLLEGLAWFEKTAVADSLPFLADADPQVAAQAGEIVASRISSVEKRQAREKIYAAALTLMADDSPDREILLTTLENDKKAVCLNVLHEMEGARTSRPELWRRLTEIYRGHFGRPYVSHIDAILHYDPRDEFSMP